MYYQLPKPPPNKREDKKQIGVLKEEKRGAAGFCRSRDVEQVLSLSNEIKQKQKQIESRSSEQVPPSPVYPSTGAQKFSFFRLISSIECLLWVVFSFPMGGFFPIRSSRKII